MGRGVGRFVTNLKQVEAALRDVGSRSITRGRETYWQCPLHEDGDPSLAVALGDDGCVVFQCFPCESRYRDHTAYVAKLLKRLGLSWGDVSPSGSPLMVASYDYEREDGQYLFSVFRFEPKSFR